MNSEEKKSIEDVIWKIMSDGKKITSSHFLHGYNMIYKHCTAKNNKYEVLGIEIYEILSLQLKKYVIENIRNEDMCGSLNKFSKCYKKFAESVSVLSHVFRYLSRHFIKINRDLCDSSILEIKSLALTSLYNNALLKNEALITGALLAELKKPQRARLPLFKSAIHAYKQILIYSGNPKDFASFLTDYIQMCRKELNGSRLQAFEFCKILKKRLYVTRKIFDAAYSAKVSENLISSIKDRKEELIDFFLTRISEKSEDTLHYEVISLLNAMDYFLKKLQVFLRGEIHAIIFLYNDRTMSLEKGFEYLYNFYIKLNPRFRQNPLLGKAFSEAFDKFSNSDLEKFIPPKIHKYICTKDTVRLKFIVTLVNNFYLSQELFEYVLGELQRRLIFFQTNVDIEEEFIHLLDSKKYGDFKTRANRCILDIKHVLLISNYHGLYKCSYYPYCHIEITKNNGVTRKPFSNQELIYSFKNLRNNLFNLNPEVNSTITNRESTKSNCGLLVFLSKQFWNRPPTKHFEIADELKNIERFLVRNKRNTYYEEKMIFDYNLSRVIFKINGCTIMASSLHYTIISILEEKIECTQEHLEKIIKTNIFSELQSLLKNNLIILNYSGYTINYNYFGDEIDIFDYETYNFQKPTFSPSAISECEQHTPLKCQIIRILKRIKKMGMDELKAQVNCDTEVFDNIIQELEKSDLVKQKNNMIHYLP